jgi:hypothetical protein
MKEKEMATMANVERESERVTKREREREERGS